MSEDKKSTIKYGNLPEKEAEAIPWDKLCVDLIGPYVIKNKINQENLTLWCVTMIDPATSWFEMKSITDKTAINVAHVVETTWLSRYPWPQEIVYDQGSEFMAEFAIMVEDNYGITKRPITTRNPQANSIIERIHQTLGNIIRTFELQESDMSASDSWEGILSAVMFALRSTYHTTLDATPMQLVYGRDAILNIKFEADWQYIKRRKQKLIRQNNQRENKKRIVHTYRPKDRVLYDTSGMTKNKFGRNPFEGPYIIKKVNTNGTVLLKMGPILETVNIRRIKPFKE